MKTRYFHASPYRLRVGTILLPDSHRCNYGDHGLVFLTTSDVPHFTVLNDAVRDNWHVYEVEPLGDLMVGEWEDLCCYRAEVVRYVGQARGIVARAKRGRQKPESYLPMVRDHQVARIKQPVKGRMPRITPRGYSR